MEDTKDLTVESNETRDAETILFEHNAEKENIQAALDVAKMFIMRKKRILTGGMAIDLALRLKGTQLYASNKLPDYDCYSPEHCKDAYELADELVEKGFKSVTAIRAFHISTMKVRVNFQDVADISYVPQTLFDIIPTLNTEGFVVVHPHFQVIDQHRALSLPYEKPPLETVFGRWKKDIQRHSLLLKYYPIEMSATNSADVSTTKVVIDDYIRERTCVSGVAAAQYWLYTAQEEGYAPDKNILFGHAEYENGKLAYNMPSNVPMSLLSRDVFSIISQHSDAKWRYFNELLDKIPRSVTAVISANDGDRTYEFIDTKGILVSATTTDTHVVANIQFVMCYLLSLCILKKDKDSDGHVHANIYHSAYTSLAKIVDWATQKYIDALPADREKFRKYLPDVRNVYGEINENWYPAYLFSRYESFNRNAIAGTVPKNYYPTANTDGGDEAADTCAFDATTSVWFQFDGAECQPFKERSKYL